MTIEGLLSKIQNILDKIVPFIIGLAVFVIIWGIFKYISHAADEEKRSEARQFIIYGIIGVFFMLSIWGFVNILVNTFSLNGQIDSDKIPKVPQIGSNGTEGSCNQNGTDAGC